MSETISRYMHFLWAGLSKHSQTGGLVPSQRFLIEKMLAPIPRDYSGLIVELGPGCGALTLRLAARCPRARIVACEINPILARDTRHLMQQEGFGDQVEVVNDAAENVLTRIARTNGHRPEFIVSGIPLGNLEEAETFALIDAIRAALADGGMYIQFQHSFIDRKRIQAKFSQFRTAPVLLNIPPAVVYYAQKHGP